MDNIELIIFDLDGTMYDLSDVVEMNYEIQKKFLAMYKKMSDEDIRDLFKKNDIFSYKTKNAKSATELFLKMGINRKEWNNYREAHFDVCKIRKEKAVDISIIKQYCQIAPLVLLSSNSYNNIVKVLKWLGITDKCFKEIICCDRCKNLNDFNKKSEIMEITQKYNIEYSKILSIGDRYNTDILPLIEIGGKGILVSHPSDLNNVLAYLNGDNEALEERKIFCSYN